MTAVGFESWLRSYGAAWENRDSAAAARLFTQDAEYYWTPFDAPQRGREQIAAAWDGAVAQQRDVHFEFEVLAVTSTRNIARWRAEFSSANTGDKVRLDGILTAEFDANGRCRAFREWWHRSGGPG